jgi:hypothetical protein
MLKLASVILGLGVASFIALCPGAAEKAEAKADKKAEAAKKPLTEQERAFAETMKAIAPEVGPLSPKQKEAFVLAFQEGRLLRLRTNLLGYEHKLMATPANNPQAQASCAWQVASYEKIIRKGAKELIDLDPESDMAKQAKQILRRLELLKKNGPTT